MPHDALALSPEEIQRYHRHLILPSVGEEGQRRLKAARVLLVGAGGLGSPAALYLAAAGVGHIGVIDDDVVELNNLQRQVLHGTSNVGAPKVRSASERLYDLNPHVEISALHARLSSANALEIIKPYDIVVDGSDNFPTRYLINDACIILRKQNVYGSASRFDGQATVFGGMGGPCYRCLFPEPPAPGSVQNCADGGVFGVLPGLIGVIQATETIKLITGIGETLIGRLLLVDALRMRFESIALAGDPECRSCGTREISVLQDYASFCGESSAASFTGPGMNDDEHDDTDRDEITPKQLAARLRDDKPPVLLDVREPYEWSIARIGEARLIPLNSLPSAIHSLDPAAETVVYCHHGARSEAAVAWLHDQGFARVLNLVGGIDRWSLEVDPAVRRY